MDHYQHPTRNDNSCFTLKQIVSSLTSFIEQTNCKTLLVSTKWWQNDYAWMAVLVGEFMWSSDSAANGCSMLKVQFLHVLLHVHCMYFHKVHNMSKFVENLLPVSRCKGAEM